jgi:hypothetical protein
VVRALVVAALVLIAACTPVTMTVHGWSVTCVDTPSAECEGVAAVFINNLARNQDEIREKSGARLRVEPHQACSGSSEWPSGSSCWQATAAVTDGLVCMVIAQRLSGSGTPAGFGQVGGDNLSLPGNPRSGPPCS